MEKEFLIKLFVNEDESEFPTIIKTIETEKITEYLKLYKEAKENDIPIKINNSYVNKLNGKEAFVTDIKISFGDNISFTSLEIYVDIF